MKEEAQSDFSRLLTAGKLMQGQEAAWLLVDTQGLLLHGIVTAAERSGSRRRSQRCWRPCSTGRGNHARCFWAGNCWAATAPIRAAGAENVHHAVDHLAGRLPPTEIVKRSDRERLRYASIPMLGSDNAGTAGLASPLNLNRKFALARESQLWINPTHKVSGRTLSERIGVGLFFCLLVASPPDGIRICP